MPLAASKRKRERTLYGAAGRLTRALARAGETRPRDADLS